MAAAGLPRAIIHLDDYGLSRSTNRAVERALLNGWASSASVMVPCPWFRDAAAFAAAHPELCIGVHITLVAEWERYKWRPLIGPAAARSLCDDAGFLAPNAPAEEFARRAIAAEAKAEARAQIQLALDCGMRPSHLDAHCDSIMASAELRAALFELARDFDIPAVVPRHGDDSIPAGTPALRLDEFLCTMGEKETLEQTLEKLRGTSGLAYVILHPAEADDELRAICLDKAPGAEWGADHRAADLRGLERQPLKGPGAVARMVSCRDAYAAQQKVAQL